MKRIATLGKRRKEKNEVIKEGMKYIYIVNSILRKLANFRATTAAKAGGNSSGDRFKVAAVKHETATNYIINHIPWELPYNPTANFFPANVTNIICQPLSLPSSFHLSRISFVNFIVVN